MRLSLQNSKNWFLSKSFLQKNLVCQGKDANGLITNVGVE